jgi:hypothetical protein
MALLDAGVVLVILLGCSTLGLRVRPLLSERHRSREVIEFVQLVVAMLVTFAALVLGLLTSSVKTSFDKVGDDLRGLAIQLIHWIARFENGAPKPSPRATCCGPTPQRRLPRHGPGSPNLPAIITRRRPRPGPAQSLRALSRTTCWLASSSLFANWRPAIRCIGDY